MGKTRPGLFSLCQPDFSVLYNLSDYIVKPQKKHNKCGNYVKLTMLEMMPGTKWISVWWPEYSSSINVWEARGKSLKGKDQIVTTMRNMWKKDSPIRSLRNSHSSMCGNFNICLHFLLRPLPLPPPPVKMSRGGKEQELVNKRMNRETGKIMIISSWIWQTIKVKNNIFFHKSALETIHTE